ncbi:helix-turn-helix domain-containing protein [Candidatus Enterococcus leclercqii]|uniref:helix-turn-helix domain-containing protein n=1 Tax=Candidatus Enterococcus leclercqii TaxID=1857218 RepID=UPI00137AF2BA|nr:Rgg/GadR/MutR family transcriptional regulator [Enterococcus sp. CU9D]KAF1291388.1 transcriptional regulator [Enterococcus sp. CU9D]
MEHQSLIKKLRTDRGISQEKLAQGISRRSTLASFERQATKISYDMLVQYLDRMNITLEEYQFLLDDGNLSEKRGISVLFYQKLTKEYDAAFSDMLFQKYNETGESYYQLLRSEYLLVMKKDNRDLVIDEAKEKQVLSAYLDAIEDWGRFELAIFINTLFCFDDDYILMHFKRSVKKMKGYIDNLYYSRDILAFLINGVVLGFERKSKQLFDVFFPELRFFADELKSMEADITWRVFQFLSTDDIYSNKKKYELFFILEYLGKEEYISYIEKNLPTSD